MASYRVNFTFILGFTLMLPDKSFLITLTQFVRFTVRMRVAAYALKFFSNRQDMTLTACRKLQEGSRSSIAEKQ